MEWAWVAALAVLWLLVLFVAFIVLGLLRQLSYANWRIEQLAATMPSRIRRDGLSPGRSAPEFTLPAADGGEVSLSDFAGRRVLLVFTQPGCGPCEQIVPALNDLERRGPVRTVVISNGELAATRAWAAEHVALFPVLSQEHFRVSRQYEVFATPFAFAVDERGRIAAKGIVNTGEHIRFLLEGMRDGPAEPAKTAAS